MIVFSPHNSHFQFFILNVLVQVAKVDHTHFQGEDEYLFAAYSTFTVRSCDWPSRLVVLEVASDNRMQPEDCPLCPWM